MTDSCPPSLIVVGHLGISENAQASTRVPSRTTFFFSFWLGFGWVMARNPGSSAYFRVPAGDITDALHVILGVTSTMGFMIPQNPGGVDEWICG